MRLLAIIACALAAFAGASGAPTPAKAWGKLGHLTICDLAYRNLTPVARTELNALLQSKTGGITVKGRGKADDRHYTSFNVGCLEEDALPRRHPEDHFINIDRSATTIGADCPGGGDCILAGIQRDLTILKDRAQPREARVFALMAVGHWVGDIHQPLHVSFADDRGGNGIDAKLTGRCGGTSDRPDNLHAIWDNCLLDAGLFERVRKRSDFDPKWSRFTITYRAVDTLLANTSVAEERTLVGADPSVWANESLQVTLDPAVLYCTKVGGECRYSASVSRLAHGGAKRTQAVDQAYLASYEKVVQERVRLAGFRLAHLLNLALDPAYTQPQADGTQPH